MATGPNAPMVTIALPAPGLAIDEGATLELAGSATDPQDGALDPAALSWSSSLDGPLGSGSALMIASPSVGVHTITLSATDSDGNRGEAAVGVLVEALDFLDGQVDNPEIGIVVNSTGNALRLFQLGNPAERRDIALGASSAVTPTGIAIRGEIGAVPLGNAASVAIVDLRSRQLRSFFLFESGNATGAAFVNDTIVLVANQRTDQVGRFNPDRSGGAIVELVQVVEFPTAVVAYDETRAFVISSNLDDNYQPIGEGVVTAIDPGAMKVAGRVETGGTNPQFGRIGPDGMLYVINTGDYAAPSTLAIIDPGTLERVALIEDFPAGSGHVHISADGILFASAFFAGTVAWNTTTKTFVRDSSNPICAPLAGGACRGAFASHTAADGSLYQTFFGSARQGLAPQIFRYESGSFVLADSLNAGSGPVGLDIRSFR